MTRKQGQALLDIYTSTKEDKGVYHNGEEEEDEEEDKQVCFIVFLKIHSFMTDRHSHPKQHQTWDYFEPVYVNCV